MSLAPKIPLPAGVDFLAHKHPVLAVACPDCKARAGAWCKRPSGHKAFAQLHSARKRAADRIWEKYGVPDIVRRADGSWAYGPRKGESMTNKQTRKQTNKPRRAGLASLIAGGLFSDMDPVELEGIRAAIGISQAKLAAALGQDPRTMRRYIAGDLEIPRTMAIALRALDELGLKAGDLDRALD